MAKQPKRCLVETDGSSGFVLFPRALPMAYIILMESKVLGWSRERSPLLERMAIGQTPGCPRAEVIT